MAGWFGVFGGSRDKASKPIYSIEYLQHLYNRLQHIKNDDDQNRDTIVEVIRQITEALIWDEQNGHDHNFFDFFCEKNILADFVTVLGVPKVPKTVKVQLLQTLSMLVQNIRRDTSLYYLLSRNYVNQLISTQFEWSDEEILGYYISFLKSLALRLNAETIKFFFNERAAQFPLYIEAVRFFGHHEQMVRTAVRTATLQVYSVEDVAMQKFVLDRSSRTYFVHLACHTRELWAKLDQAAIRAGASSSAEQAATALQEANEQQQDLLMYISDVMGLENVPLSEALAERLLSYAMFPALLGSLLPESLHSTAADAGTGDDTSSPSGATACLLSPATALFINHQVFDVCSRSRLLLEPLAAALLLPRMPARLLQRCVQAPPPPPSSYRATNPDVSGPASQPTGQASEDGEEAAWEVEGGSPLRTTVLDAVGELDDDQEAEVSVRSYLLACLEGPTDACVLLAAGLLHACLSCRRVLPETLLVRAGLLPSARLSSWHSIDRLEPSSTVPGTGEGVDLSGHPLELILIVTRALERHTSLRVIVVQALVQLAVDLLADLSTSPAAVGWRPVLCEAVGRVIQSAAKHVRTYVQGESFLDVFAEEWHAHCRPPVAMREACSSVRCLLPVGACNAATGLSGVVLSPEWALPTSHSERQHAAKAIRCLLTVRELLTQPPLVSPAPEAAEREGPARPIYPLQVVEETADGYEEGRAFELGRRDRIVCNVWAPEGRKARYLVLHQFLLLLVQPDSESSGWAVVKTLAPVRQVESIVDRADPRTLQLHIRLLRGAPCPGEASPSDTSGRDAASHVRLTAEESRNSSLFSLTLNFEDVKRCHCADFHLRKRRAEVRDLLQQRAQRFVEGLCV